MQEKIARIWYENENLRILIMREGQIISDHTESVDQDWVGAKLIGMASRGYLVRPQNFKLNLERDNKRGYGR